VVSVFHEHVNMVMEAWVFGFGRPRFK